MKKFAVFDIDGTLIRWQLYHALADRLAKLGHIDARVFQSITEARMEWKRRKHNEAFKEYELELVKLFERILKEINVGHFQEAANDVFEEYKDQVYIYTRDLIERLREEGYLLFAISASQAVLVQKIASYYQFDDFIGAEYTEVSGRFTGEVKSIYGRKGAALKELAAKHHVGFGKSIAVGDSTSDVAMFELVEKPIVFNPEIKLFDIAQSRGWKVVIERKNVVFELEQQNGKYQLVKTNG
jgi:HAD superfamily hydrolase (TIGR01490 family)